MIDKEKILSELKRCAKITFERASYWYEYADFELERGDFTQEEYEYFRKHQKNIEKEIQELTFGDLIELEEDF